MGNKIMDLIEMNKTDTFYASSIMTPIEEIAFFNINDDILKVNHYLYSNNFDLGIVKINNNNIGYVLYGDIKNITDGKIKDNVIKIISDQKINYNSPLGEIINLFNKYKYLFIFTNKQFKGIITYADLNKDPIKIICFMAISKYENLLRDYILRKRLKDSWLICINEDKRKEISIRHIEERMKGIDRSLIQYTNMLDLMNIIKKDKDFFHKFIINDINKFENEMKIINDWRNSIMHNKTIINNDNGGKELYSFIDNIGKYIISLKNIDRMV